jgi:tetratricopeptide (TPR) repeat protein
MRNRRFVLALHAGLALFVATTLPGCRSGTGKIDPSTVDYPAVVSAFYIGLAALQTGEDSRAEEQLTRATQLAPDEPAPWADLGLLSLRQREYDPAAQRLERARSLAPDETRIAMLLGLVESGRGRFPEAIAAYQKAVELDAGNVKAAYLLAQELERQGSEGSDAEVERVYDQILAREPDNIAVLLEKARVSAKRGDSASLRAAVDRIAARAAAWPPEVQQQLRALQDAAAGGDPKAAGSRVAFLKNVLARVPDFRNSLAAVRTPAEIVAEPITRFLALPSPVSTPAARDEALTFVSGPLAGSPPGEWSVAVTVPLDAEGQLRTAVVSQREARIGDLTLPFPGGDSAPSAHSVVAADLDYDFKSDIVFAGGAGIALFRQDAQGAFVDVTASAKLPAPVQRAPYTGAWSADVDLDGDLDLVLGTETAASSVLQNNGDLTFTPITPFADVTGLRDFAWADLDSDGDPDAALVDGAGTLHVFVDERSGQFKRDEALPKVSGMVAVSASDFESDALFDLAALGSDGTVTKYTLDTDAGTWSTTKLVEGSAGLVEPARLHVEDMDNNGCPDLVVAGRTGYRVLLGDERFAFAPLSALPGAGGVSAADVTGDGRLDLVGISEVRQPVLLANTGSKNYNWQIVRPRAKETTGDQRINSFGVGGVMEIRAGLFLQRRRIDGPAVHFGLGETARADVVRVVWPNGTVQAEYDLVANQSVLAEQRLKGSCPWLFAFDGERVRFVTDILWRSPLGLRINAQDTAGVVQTEDWVKVRGDQLAPRDGYYDLRITAELWETHFFDHVSLVAVDHPSDTEVFVDERFSIPPPPLEVRATTRLRPVASATDDLGDDVTDVVRERDGRYLDTFGRGAYQGVTRDHFVEIDLGDAASEDALVLVASGWLHPTDSSINVALGQGKRTPPTPLSLEVPDGRGGWRVAKSGLGFPAGKHKTILLDLGGVYEPGAPRRLRLRTNLEIFWDSIDWATALPSADVTTHRIASESADLRFRGYSTMGQADRSSPELPDYERLAGTAPRWIDLVGYYTRFGDVRPLLAGVDDRYVILNAGDEILLRFAALPPPPEGWTRDFVFVSDGWEKDGDFNTTFSKTVLPLPSHDRPEYNVRPDSLEDDPVYKVHAQDWQEYHTRYVTPRAFHEILKPQRP